MPIKENKENIQKEKKTRDRRRVKAAGSGKLPNIVDLHTVNPSVPVW